MTQYCAHRHAEVTQHDCGLCFLSGEADVDFYRNVPSKDAGDGLWEYVARVVNGGGWDQCRLKHIEEAKAA